MLLLQRNDEMLLFALHLLQTIDIQRNALKYKCCIVLFSVVFSSTNTTKTTENNKIYKNISH